MHCDDAFSATCEANNLAIAASFKNERPASLRRAALYHQTRRLNFSRKFGILKFKALEFCNWATELLPLQHVVHGVIKSTLGKTDHLGPDTNPPFIQSLNGNFVANTNLAKHIFSGDFAIVEIQFDRARRADA